MLAIRLQRTGRSGHAQFRVVVQDSRFSPVRGRVTAYLGSYDPHTKTAVLDGEKAAKYLENGAQPSDRVAKLLQKEGVKLPDWVKVSQPKQRTVRNADKRRSTRPAEAAAPAPEAEVPAERAPKTAEAPAQETPAEETQAEPAKEEPAEELPQTEEPTVDKPPAEQPPAEPDAS